MISNNIFLWHESEDINKKSLFPKFQLIPISHLQVMHDYVCFIAPIDYCVEYSLVYEIFCENCAHFILKWFQANYFGELWFLWGELRKYTTNSNFKNFESALYSTSVSMPLRCLCMNPAMNIQTHSKIFQTFFVKFGDFGIPRKLIFF